MKTRAFFAALALLVLPAAAAHAQVLVPTDANYGPLAIKTQRVSVQVKDQVARTHIEQVFVSNADQALEATYVFPIPDDVAVSEFSMWMNGKKVTGEVLESDKARSVYEGIVARMRDPGLLEFAGRRLLRARVYPVPARGEQKIEVEYGEVTKVENGIGRYTYPLATGGKSTRVQGTLSLRVKIESKVAIKSVYSPTHKVSVDRDGDHAAIAGFEEKGSALDRDFTCFWTMSEKDVGLNLLSWKEHDGEDGYFVVMMAPKVEIAKSEVSPKDVEFVIDTSGSMDDGHKMPKAKEALRYVLGTLNEKDRFNIIRFSTGVEGFARDLVPASSDEIAKAKKFVDGLDAAGGTAIDDALAEAFKIKPESGRPAIIVFITDGEPTVGETEPEEILKHVGKRIPDGVRLFTFGVGADLNALLLDRLANDHGGVPEYAAGGEEIEAKVSGFAQKINAPVMSGLAVDFGKTDTYDVYPKNVPDLFKGGQVTLFGRYKGGGPSAVTLTGTLQGKKQSMTYEGTFAPKPSSLSADEDPNGFIPRLWATRKVGFLLDEIRAHGETAETKDEVIKLARQFGIVTPYTSYLVTQDQEVAMNVPPPPPVRRVENRPWGLPASGSAFGASAGGGRAADSSNSAPRPTAIPGAAAKAASHVVGGYAGGGDDLAAMPAMEAASGEAGVSTSIALKDKREKEVLDRDDSGMTRASGRAFVRRGGAWMDTEFSGHEKTLKVKYLSP
ncbi:MAG TPA: VIT and VWA domain-containing protein, partial [bacterium]|nr:VIT and VWA domain-containing protein [bacterium]